MPPVLPTVVVVIATHNRLHRLEACLRALQAQRLPQGLEARIRVVDNGSPAASHAALVRLAAQLRPIPVEVLHLPTAGKSAALNLALADLECDVVAFTDDDMCPEPGWLAAFWQHFQQCSCAGLQGSVTIGFPSLPPPWLTAASLELLGATMPPDHGTVEGLHGANMAVRMAVARHLGGFRLDLGPRAGQYRSAEDLEWSRRILALGERLCGCPQAASRHMVEAANLTRWALFRRQFEQTRRETRERLGAVRSVGLAGELRRLLAALLWRRRHFEGFDYGLEIAQRCGRIAGLLTAPRHLASPAGDPHG